MCAGLLAWSCELIFNFISTFKSYSKKTCVCKSGWMLPWQLLIFIVASIGTSSFCKAGWMLHKAIEMCMTVNVNNDNQQKFNFWLRRSRWILIHNFVISWPMSMHNVSNQSWPNSTQYVYFGFSIFICVLKTKSCKVSVTFHFVHTVCMHECCTRLTCHDS